MDSDTTSHAADLCEICDRLKHMGYAEAKRIRIYGEEFQVISDPFPDGNGVSVRAVSKREVEARVVRLPLPVLQTVKRRKIA